MTAKILSFAKEHLLWFASKIIIGLGLLPFFLLLTDRYGIKRKINRDVAFPFVVRRKNSNFQILSYHRINNERDPFFGAVPVSIFMRQMEFLGKHFNVLPLEQLMERALKHDIPPKAVAITFDDGYGDNYENAFPILKKYELPATIFLTTGPLDSEYPLWHDRVFFAFRNASVDHLFIDGVKYPLNTVLEKYVAMNAFLLNIRKCDPLTRDYLIDQLIAEIIEGQSCNYAKKLSWEEIAEMSKENISFGAHTVTHPILTRMNLAEAMDEILTSRTTIEERLGSQVKSFAYPNGSIDDYNGSIKNVLKETGFLCAVTTIWGANNINTDPFELRRIGIWDSNPEISLLRLAWYSFSS